MCVEAHKGRKAIAHRQGEQGRQTRGEARSYEQGEDSRTVFGMGEAKERRRLRKERGARAGENRRGRDSTMRKRARDINEGSNNIYTTRGMIAGRF